MARVVDVELKNASGRPQPSQVTAFVKVFEVVEGQPIVQIDTLGSSGRDQPGKQSQTLQFDRKSAEQLYRILHDTYRFKS